MLFKYVWRHIAILVQKEMTMSISTNTLLRTLHRIAGGAAFLLIATFWLATVLVELGGSHVQIVAVKTAVAWGVLLLVPTLAATGASGLRLARGHISGVLALKLRRMKFIAANGLLILVPSAVSLATLANRGDLDGLFVPLQAVELIAGGVNLVLIGLNIRDGLRMRRLAGRDTRYRAPLAR